MTKSTTEHQLKRADYMRQYRIDNKEALRDYRQRYYWAHHPTELLRSARNRPIPGKMQYRIGLMASPHKLKK